MRDPDSASRVLREERILKVLTLVVLFLAAAVSSLYRFRIDLTEDRAFTLSPASRSLGARIPETVDITYYRSEALADLHPGIRMAQDLLAELEAHGGGRIRVSVKDAAENAGRLESLGILPRQLQVEGGGEARIATVYAGVVVEYLDDFRVLPSVLGSEHLEYEVVKAVRDLVNGTVPVAALREGDGNRDPEEDYRLLRAALVRAGHEVRLSPRGSDVEPDVSVLFVLGTAALDEYDAYYIDRYLSGGGRVFAAVRGVLVDPDRNLEARALDPDPVLELLDAYGVRVRRELVLDVSSLSIPFEVQGPDGRTGYRNLRYPHWVVTERENTALSHPAAARYSGLDLYWPSPLELSARPGLAGEVLVKSSPRAWKQTRAFAAAPDQEAFYRDEEDATRGQYALAAALDGTFPRVYQTAPPPRPGSTRPIPGPLPADDLRPGRLVVAGSSDFLTDLMGMSGSEANAFFAVSAADWLSSADDLPLPAVSRSPRRIRLPEDEDARRRVVGAVYFLNILLVPALAGLFALLRAVRRSRAEKAGRAA